MVSKAMVRPATGRQAGAPGLSLREEQREVARQRILVAALEVFVSAGYRSATVDKITALAGMSRATFYLYFKGKKDIIAALVEENIIGFRDIYMAVPLERDSSEAEIGRWIDSLFQYYRDMQQRVILYRQAAIIDPDVKEMSESNYASIIDANWERISGGVSSRSADCKALRMRFRLFMGLVDSAIYLSVVRGVIDPKVSRGELLLLWKQFWGPGGETDAKGGVTANETCARVA